MEKLLRRKNPYELTQMKGEMGLNKIISIAFCILLLGSLALTVGTAMALNYDFGFPENWAGEAIIDGAWTNTEEWMIGMPHQMGTDQKGMWIMQANTDSGGYWPEYLVEFADGTPDAGDKIWVCMTSDGETSTTPTIAEVKVELQGTSTKNVFDGTGSGWAASPSASAAHAAGTRGTTAHDPAEHVIAEFRIEKEMWGMGAPPLGVHIGCYDESTNNTVVWPPGSSADNPMTWGVIDGYTADPWPEGLTIGVMLALSSVAAVVSLRYFKKPPKL